MQSRTPNAGLEQAAALRSTTRTRCLQGPVAELGLVLGFGLLLRLVHLSSYSFGPSEANAVLAARCGSGTPSLHPLFLRILDFWATLGMTDHEWSARLISVLGGLATILLVYELARNLFGNRGAATAALLVALSPAFVLTSQELTAPALMNSVLLLPVVALARAARKPSIVWWGLFACCSGLALYAAPSAAVLLLSLNLWFLVAQLNTRNAAAWCAANLLGWALYAPQAYVLFRDKPWLRLAAAAQDAWPQVLYRLAVATTAGYCEPPSLSIATTGILSSAAGLGVLIACVRNWQRGSLLVFLLFPPLAAFAWLVSMGIPISSVQLLPFALPGLIACAVAVNSIPRAGWRLGVTTGLSTALLLGTWHALFLTPWYTRPPEVVPAYQYGQAVEYVTRHWQGGDVLLHTDASSVLPFALYQPEALPSALVAGINAPPLDACSRDISALGRAYSGPRKYLPLEPSTRTCRRTWLIFSAADRERLPKNPAAVKRWMDAHFFEVDHQVFQGIEVFLFERKLQGHWTRLVVRDQDDGVSAEQTYWYGPQRTYHAVREDAGAVPKPPDKRRGALRLAFSAAAPADDLIVLASDAPTAEDAFSLTNTGADRVRLQLMVAATTRLVDMASLTAHEADASAWQPAELSNPNPPPPSWPLSSVTALLEAKGKTEGKLNGGIHLDAGEYAVYLFQYATAHPSNKDQAQVTLTISDEPLYRAVANVPGRPTGWNWTQAGMLTMKLKDDYVHIDVTVALPPPLTTARWDCAYLALVRQPDHRIQTQLASRSFWSDELELKPGETRHWHIVHDIDLERMDVWVLESGGEGLAYRIFRESKEK